MKRISDSHGRSWVMGFTAIAIVTASYSIFSMLLMSDFGQFFGLPKSWIITYYRFKILFGTVNVA